VITGKNEDRGDNMSKKKKKRGLRHQDKAAKKITSNPQKNHKDIGSAGKTRSLTGPPKKNKKKRKK